jgi:cytochrome c551
MYPLRKDESDMCRQARLGIFMIIFIMTAGCGSKTNLQAGSQTPAAAAETSEANVRAAELFKKINCISCHGVDLSGRVGPKTNLQKIGATTTREQIAHQIREGGGGMPAYKAKLTEKEVTLLADWLSTKN